MRTGVQFPSPPPEMYLCICNNVKEGEIEKYHLIGTNCGKCISDGGVLDSTGNASIVENRQVPTLKGTP